MSYSLGVDLGTSYTAAATARNGRVEIANLGNQSATIPSVVLLKEDQTILTGEAADRRSITEPDRVAREFKRRVGDTTPLFLGGAPQSAEALMARLLRWVADEVAAREGGPADRLAICHPANWGQYKKDLLAQAVRMADLGTAAFLSEPEAAAIYYASMQRVEVGTIVAVYDLGGGTFDAAVLRKTDDGFEILGEPEGIERLGGIDFDAAVFAHVARSLGGALEALDEDDPASIAAVARLRGECIAAKEALSSDTDASIQVLLPTLSTEVRLTRSEFEVMIRPSLADSISAMRRALASAGVDTSDVSTVLLVGGSSRIPLIAQIVGAELGIPVSVDAHPKHAIALGAALAAASDAVSTPLVPVIAPTGTPDAPPPTAVAPTAPPVPAAAAAVAAAVPESAPLPTEAITTPEAPPQRSPSELDDTSSTGGKGLKILAAVLVICVLGGVGAFFALSGGGDEPSAVPADSAGAPVDTAALDTTAAPEPEAETTVATTAAPTTSVAPETTTATTIAVPAPDFETVRAGVIAAGPELRSLVDVQPLSERSVIVFGLVYDEEARSTLLDIANVSGMDEVVDQMVLQSEDEQCTEAIQNLQNWVCILGVSWDGETLQAFYSGSPQDGQAAWSLASIHLHFFGSNIPVVGAGAAGPYSDGSGAWQIWDDPNVFTGTLAEIGSPDAVPDKVCARVANGLHTLESLDSGNCWPVTVSE